MQRNSDERSAGNEPSGGTAAASVDDPTTATTRARHAPYHLGLYTATSGGRDSRESVDVYCSDEQRSYSILYNTKKFTGISRTGKSQM